MQKPVQYAKLMHDVNVPEPFRVVEGSEFLREGTKITPKVLPIKVQLVIPDGADESTRLSYLLKKLTLNIITDQNTETVVLAPRVYVAYEEEAKRVHTFDKTWIAPHQNYSTIIRLPFTLDQPRLNSGWVIDVTSLTPNKPSEVDYPHDPRHKGGEPRPDLLTCSDLAFESANTNEVHWVAQGDNNSGGDSGSCSYSFNYSIFRYVLKGIP